MIGHAIASVTIKFMGWPFSFYLSAIIGGLFCLNWMFYVRDRPDMHTRAILDEEKLYIESAIGPLTSKDKVSTAEPPYRNFNNLKFVLEINSSLESN